MKSRSIRFKLVATITFFVALLLVAMATGTYIYFKSATEKLIVDQQFATITNIAHDLDHEITVAHKALINTANFSPADVVSSPVATQKWLDSQYNALTTFGHSMIILDKAGTLIASTPAHPELYGTSFAHRDYFINTMKSFKPVISAPYVTALNDNPVISMTALLRNDDGSIKGLLSGSIDLMEKDSIFEGLRGFRIGSSGYLYLFAQDRTMIMHPDRARIMKQDVLPGANLLFDQALEGFEGSGETINSKGIGFLASFKRLESTGWILAANYRLSEAFVPVTQFRNYFLSGVFFILLLAAALSWKLGSGIARPIEGFARKLNELAQPNADRKQRLDDSRKDELGQLAQSFNTLLDEIQRNVNDLEDAQIQVMQSEKLASVGQLAAGVAHEINNPIGFINSNLGTLKGQVEDLLKVLASYQNAESALAEHPELLAAIKRAKSAADLEFLQEDIANLINESLEGVHRVKKIVDNLKDFSRVDTAEWQYANLETALESTLNIVSNEIKYKAEVIREFAGLPEIDCIVSQLNQVFLNLLVNAAQAIDEHGTITLRTGFDDNHVWVDVADTGSGINPEHLGKIFDPFFTTKPIGKGTGLGLSLAYGIVKRHHGKLEVRSELGKGTTFRVTLPRARGTVEVG